MNIQHHGAVNGVTGSCHQLHIDEQNSVLIDCGLFQGTEQANEQNTENDRDGRIQDSLLSINFDISTVNALVVTHCHIDHVGLIPYLLAAGFRGPIYATTVTAALLPLVIEDALKVGVTRNKSIISACLKLLKNQLIPLKYKQWQEVELNQIASSAPQKPSSLAKSSTSPSYLNSSPFVLSMLKEAVEGAKEEASACPEPVEGNKVKIKFQPAGHILGSAYVEIDIQNLKDKKDRHRFVFSGDLGAPYAPLLQAPKSPYRADTLIIESTYGDKKHQSRKTRTNHLQKIIEKAVADNGVVLIPAFSIGRTQELLYELEQIIHRKASSPMWQNIYIIIDSPMAAKFTDKYQDFKHLWDAEAKREIKSGRHPLSFEQLYTVDSHQEHMQTVEYLAKRNKPAIVIAASGMCSGGRIVNYLKQFLNDETADIIFLGYQAPGTLGRNIQKYRTSNNSKSNKTGYVFIDGERVNISAGVHTISGYSVYADQNGLINFVNRIRHKSKHIKIVHGGENAKATLAEKYHQLLPNAIIEIAR